jgi:hypothetical protein
MPAVVLNINGLLMLAFKDADITIIAHSYYEMLQDLHIAIKRKYPRILMRDVIMLHNNACIPVVALPRTCCTPHAGFV